MHLLVNLTEGAVSLSSNFLQVYVAYLLYKFSIPVVQKRDPILKRNVNFMTYLRTETVLRPLKTKFHSRASEAEMEQAIRSY